jgi:hypothetical protein
MGQLYRPGDTDGVSSMTAKPLVLLTTWAAQNYQDAVPEVQA